MGRMRLGMIHDPVPAAPEIVNPIPARIIDLNRLVARSTITA